MHFVHDLKCGYIMHEFEETALNIIIIVEDSLCIQIVSFKDVLPVTTRVSLAVAIVLSQMLDLKASAVELLEVMLEDTHMDTPKLAKVSLHMQGVSEMVVSLSIVPSLTPTTLVLLL